MKEGAEFCPECGEKQPKTVRCPKCGKEYDEGTAFCGECGSKLGEENLESAMLASTEQNFDEAADKLSQAAGGRGKLVAIMGGAIALGHPLGATGTRLVASAISGLKHRNGKRALVTLCIGGGQAVAYEIENA